MNPPRTTVQVVAGGEVVSSTDVGGAMTVQGERGPIEAQFARLLEAAELDGKPRALVFEVLDTGMRVDPSLSSSDCAACGKRHSVRVRYRQGHPEVSMDGSPYRRVEP